MRERCRRDLRDCCLKLGTQLSLGEREREGERDTKRMAEIEDAMVECAGVQEPDIVVLILQHLTEPQDVLAAAAVCRFVPQYILITRTCRNWPVDVTVSVI